MRYDAESGIIKIGLYEFVSIARRGISSSLSYDEDEPRVSTPAATRLSRLGIEAREERITHRFINREWVFELSCRVEGISKNEITVARAVESDPRRPKKSEVAEIRGEGYIAAYMLARERGLDSVSIRFIYFGEGSGELSEKIEIVSKKKLEGFFNKCLVAVAIFAAPEVERVTQRLPSMKKMKFPYDRVREGQSEFVRAAYRTLSRGGCLYATAPTGTGKTVSALYPALRALGDERVEKVSLAGNEAGSELLEYPL